MTDFDITTGGTAYVAAGAASGGSSTLGTIGGGEATPGVAAPTRFRIYLPQIPVQ